MPGQAAKGNPAQTRMGSSKKKDLRARSHTRGQARKQERRAHQEEAHRRNMASDGPTPWQEAKAARYRARAPQREAWQKRQSEL
jgi:hypothetical protein